MCLWFTGIRDLGCIRTNLPSPWKQSLVRPKARGTGQSVVVFWDFNAAPGVIRAIAKAIAVLWKVLLRMRMQPSSTCQFALGGPAGIGRERRSTLGRGDTLPLGCAYSALMLLLGTLLWKVRQIFLAVVEDLLVPAVTNDLGVNSRGSSVWALACQESVPGGHAGVGAVSLRGAPFTPSFLLHSWVSDWEDPLERYFH